MQYLKFYKDLVPGDFSLKGCLHGDFPQLYILICLCDQWDIKISPEILLKFYKNQDFLYVSSWFTIQIWPYFVQKVFQAPGSHLWFCFPAVPYTFSALKIKSYVSKICRVLWIL